LFSFVSFGFFLFYFIVFFLFFFYFNSFLQLLLSNAGRRAKSVRRSSYFNYTAYFDEIKIYIVARRILMGYVFIAILGWDFDRQRRRRRRFFRIVQLPERNFIDGKTEKSTALVIGNTNIIVLYINITRLSNARTIRVDREFMYIISYHIYIYANNMS